MRRFPARKWCVLVTLPTHVAPSGACSSWSRMDCLWHPWHRSLVVLVAASFLAYIIVVSYRCRSTMNSGHGGSWGSSTRLRSSRANVPVASLLIFVRCARCAYTLSPDAPAFQPPSPKIPSVMHSPLACSIGNATAEQNTNTPTPPNAQLQHR